MFGLGPLEILVILVLALLIFGRRLPEIGRGVGKSIVEFKKGLAGIEDELRPDHTQGNQPPAAKSSSQLENKTTASLDDGHTQQPVSEKNTPHQS